MLGINTAKAMVSKLLELPNFTIQRLSQELSLHRQTITRLLEDEDFRLLPEKQLALIKLYCAKYNNKH